jgi:AraC-like DNA-binding protein
MHKDRLLKFISPSLGSSAALSALRRPVEIQDVGALQTLGGLLVDEISKPARHTLYAESLVGSIVTGLLDLPDEGSEKRDGRLTQAQMNKLTARMDSTGDHRISVADMASTVGLSESWFASVFKQTTGKTPLQWQLARRVDVARNLLDEGATVAGVAAQLGFSDQAHFTKVFRQIVGETPAAWRRVRQGL